MKATGMRNGLRGKITIERIRTTADWPKLKAKAACTRQLSRYALHLAVKYNSGSLHDRRRHGVCHLLVRYYEIIEEQPRYLSDVAKAELKEISALLFSLYLNLSEEALIDNVRMWKMTGKFHMFQHLLELPCYVGNPRYYWLYMDEDLMQLVKRSASHAHPRTICETVLYKWVIFWYDDVVNS